MKRFIIIALVGVSSLPFVSSGAYFRTTAVSSANIFTAHGAVSTVAPTSEPTHIPTLTASPTPRLVPSLSPEESDHIVISEVQISASASSNNDFIELYNPTTFPYDLNGHRLVKRGATSTTDTTIKSWNTQTIIQPHGFYLWATSDNSYHLTVGADTATSENIAVNNSIALRSGAENSGLIIDALSWNTHANSLKEGTEFSLQPAHDQSIERKAFISSTGETLSAGGVDELKGNGYDTNSNGSDFVLRMVSQPQNVHSLSEHP